VVIDNVKPSCGCTAAQLPSQPWHLRPKETAKFGALVDLRGKTGTLYKTIDVISTNAPKKLTLTIDIQPGTNTMAREMQDRIWGQQLAATDHQAVFKKTCVECHLVPAFGKSGAKLYKVACGICHEAQPRATMVPDLHALKTPIEPDYWWNWVAHGKVGTLMPGFAATEGGPLDDADIASLVKYLAKEFPRPVKSSTPEKDGKN
jgi:mono/diheme cytochrome c family protein